MTGPTGPGTTLYTTILVPAGGTPAQNGAALIAAINGISDASVSKPYLIKLEPGIFDLGTGPSYQGKPYVALEGAGRTFTTIQGNPDGTALVVLSAASELRDVTVAHLGGVTTAFPLTVFAGSAGPVSVRRVSIVNAGGTNTTYGMSINGTGNVTLEDTDLQLIVAGSGTSNGINAGAGPTLALRRVRLVMTGAGGSGLIANGISANGPILEVQDSELNLNLTQGNVTGITASGTSATVNRTAIIVSGTTTYGLSSNSTNIETDGARIRLTATGSFVGLGLFGSSANVRRAVVSGTGTTASQALDSNAANLLVEGSELTGSTSGSGAVHAIRMQNPSSVNIHAGVLNATSTGSGAATGVSLTASPATGVSVAARFDAGRVVVSGPAGTTPLFLWNQGAGSLTLSVGASLVSGAAPTVLVGTLRCVNDYNQNDVALNSSCL